MADRAGEAVPDEGVERLRIDKWLWHARFFKTRALAAALVSGGHLRINGQRMSKPGHAVVPGDVLTFMQGQDLRVVRVLACGSRRGPAPEAQTLYQAMHGTGNTGRGESAPCE